MARRPKGSVPSYRLHKQSGQAIVSLPLGNGQYRDVLLGVHGSPESRSKYARMIAEWEANDRRAPRPDGAAPADVTVAELLLRFWKHAEQHYRDPDGKPTSELHCYRLALKPLRELYEHTPASAFGPLALKAVRQQLVDAGLARRVVNKSVGRIRHCFAWAVAEELVPPTVLQALQAVQGLQKGRSTARETEPVRPVSDAAVDATLPHLNPTVRAMVQFQRFTGARPAEVCRLRPCDIDMTAGQVWLYRPHRHKTQHRDRERIVPIGPRAQAVIKPFLPLELNGYVFSPSRAVEALRAQQRARRRTPVQPSQLCRRSRCPKREPGDRYATRQYAQAVDRACERAFPPPPELARKQVEAKRGEGRWETDKEWRARLGERWPDLLAWRRANHWNLNQLRHSYLTAVRHRHGVEGAQVIAGHAEVNTTQLYAEKDLNLARRIAAEMG